MVIIQENTVKVIHVNTIIIQENIGSAHTGEYICRVVIKQEIKLLIHRI